VTDGEGQRLDLFLWQARFFKSRTLAKEIIAASRVRINGQPVSRPGRLVVPGDVLTFPQGNAIRVVKITALPTRRGPAPEAQSCYSDIPPLASAPPQG
jgi:ribosome-associated heat shock protein Hsp15